VRKLSTSAYPRAICSATASIISFCVRLRVGENSGIVVI
jgi:hypothetical protein